MNEKDRDALRAKHINGHGNEYEFTCGPNSRDCEVLDALDSPDAQLAALRDDTLKNIEELTVECAALRHGRDRAVSVLKAFKPRVHVDEISDKADSAVIGWGTEKWITEDDVAPGDFDWLQQLVEDE